MRGLLCCSLQVRSLVSLIEVAVQSLGPRTAWEMCIYMNAVQAQQDAEQGLYVMLSCCRIPASCIMIFVFLPLMLGQPCRLAPEHPFPAAVDDSYAALQWVAGNLESLGATSGKLAIGGDSAGLLCHNTPSHANPCLMAPMDGIGSLLEAVTGSKASSSTGL